LISSVDVLKRSVVVLFYT